ncbi:alpha/beta-hydrolase superfamily protein [Forsythia ovata]|uniref:Alpha/beta-hydrolase superfamily protein n=1 Tax=Forsythia ovata TaxID=205694 RepID=A0ABD1VH03_9LAMI
MALKSFLMIFTSLTIVTFTSISTSTQALPFVVFHGISDKCSNEGVTQFTELLSMWSGSQGYCIEIGNGAWDSWFMPFLKQTAIACEKVKKMSELREGYNIIGLSQGTMVGRGILEFCDGGPPVRNLISLAGPHAGISSIPFCGSTLVCILVDFLLELAVYSNFVQEHLAPTNYIKIPIDIDNYRKGCKFLPKLDNEIHRNSTYKERFTSLQNLVLIMFEKDEILVPRETSWFGYYPDGSWSPVLPAQETTLYTEDWIGLKALDEAGKVNFIKASGSHLEITYSEMKEYILPYLVENGQLRIIPDSYHVRPFSGFKEATIKLYTSN